MLFAKFHYLQTLNHFKHHSCSCGATFWLPWLPCSTVAKDDLATFSVQCQRNQDYRISIFRDIIESQGRLMRSSTESHSCIRGLFRINNQLASELHASLRGWCHPLGHRFKLIILKHLSLLNLKYYFQSIPSCSELVQCEVHTEVTCLLFNVFYSLSVWFLVQLCSTIRKNSVNRFSDIVDKRWWISKNTLFFFLSKINFKAVFPPQIHSKANTLRRLLFSHSFPAGRRYRPACPPVPASLWAQAGTIIQIFIALKRHARPDAGASYRLPKSLVSINGTR